MIQYKLKDRIQILIVKTLAVPIIIWFWLHKKEIKEICPYCSCELNTNNSDYYPLCNKCGSGLSTLYE